MEWTRRPVVGVSWFDAQNFVGCYEVDFAHAPTDGSASKEGNCANRVFRDGTFLSNPYMQRSAQRGGAVPVHAVEAGTTLASASQKRSTDLSRCTLWSARVPST